MKIKTLKIILLPVLIAFIMGSCTDVLNQDPLDKISESEVWQDDGMMEAYVTDLYSRFPFLYVQATWPHVPAGWLPNSELAVDREASTTAQTGGMSHTNDYMGYWDYSLIRDLNVFLEEVEDSPVDQDLKDRLRGEVRAFRAIVYYQMQMRYGGVPLVDVVLDPFQDIDEQYLSRNTEEEIADFIDQEFQAAIELLGEDHTETGRINKWVAYGYKARANLWAASIADHGSIQINGLVGIPSERADEFYGKAADAARAVINSGRYQLYNEHADRSENYRYLFLDDSNSEIIFERIYDGVNIFHSFPNNNYPTRFSAGQGSRTNPSLELLLGYENIDGSLTDPEFGPDNLYEDGIDLWSGKDPRLRATTFLLGESYAGSTIQTYEGLDPSPQPNPDNIISDHATTYEGIPTAGIDSRRQEHHFHPRTNHLLRKYVIDEPLVERRTHDTNWKDLRLGEIYLILAEAEYELGNLEAAATALNYTRERAGIATVNAGTITRETVRRERRNELALEGGYRWWDHRRWRTAREYLNRTEAIQGLRPILHFETGQYYFLPMDAEPYTRVFREEHYYNPITANRIEDQPQLVENPGYN